MCECSSKSFAKFPSGFLIPKMHHVLKRERFGAFEYSFATNTAEVFFNLKGQQPLSKFFFRKDQEFFVSWNEQCKIGRSISRIFYFPIEIEYVVFDKISKFYSVSKLLSLYSFIPSAFM